MIHSWVVRHFNLWTYILIFLVGLNGCIGHWLAFSVDRRLRKCEHYSHSQFQEIGQWVVCFDCGSLAKVASLPLPNKGVGFSWPGWRAPRLWREKEGE